MTYYHPCHHYHHQITSWSSSSLSLTSKSHDHRHLHYHHYHQYHQINFFVWIIFIAWCILYINFQFSSWITPLLSTQCWRSHSVTMPTSSLLTWDLWMFPSYHAPAWSLIWESWEWWPPPCLLPLPKVCCWSGRSTWWVRGTFQPGCTGQAYSPSPGMENNDIITYQSINPSITKSSKLNAHRSLI